MVYIRKYIHVIYHFKGKKKYEHLTCRKAFGINQHPLMNEKQKKNNPDKLETINE